MAFLMILGTLLAIWLCSNCFALYQNYRRALISNLPILISIGNPDNVLWMIFSVPLRLTLEKFLPSSFYENHIKASIYGWEFRDKNILHEKIGPAFLLVSSGDTELWAADPDAAQAVMARRKDFVQAPIATKILSVLGPNILSVSLSSHR
jgi:hypothetical protein